MAEESELRHPPFHTGPYLLVACLCEKVLKEADGVPSVIRIIDRINHGVIGPEPPSDMPPFDYQLMLYINFKSGSARGPMKLEIRRESPSGERSDA